MKMNKKLLALSATFVLAAQFDTVAVAASVNGTADVKVVAPLTIIENLSMDFGTIAPHLTVVDTIVMDTAGARNATGGNAQTIGGAGQAAQFTVTGDTVQTFALTFTDGTLLNPASDSISVNTFSHNSTGILATGTNTFRVGASIDIGVNQPIGDYTGTYNIAVNYN